MMTEPANAVSPQQDPHAERILVIDFGGQYTQLIARRVREVGVYSEILPYDASADAIKKFAPTGIMSSMNTLHMRFTRSDVRDSLGVSPTGRMLW